MWINKEVDLPEQLIASQREGRFVAFVGAGASMSPPSNLPSFERLAAQIADGLLARRENESVDAYLGRLEGVVDVQSRARRILSDPGSQPCALHGQIVRLFSSPATCRIVTTNFDRHLTQTAKAEFNDVDIFNAPALPLGRAFWGIVNLHGTVDRHEPLVLTDGDFGRAYLTDAWATRFLAEMFRTFTVLFIGYGHRDPVMRYLARAFGGATTGTQPRFALTLPGDDEHWASLGIVPVHYPPRAVAERHAALGEALSAWSSLARMGALEHERRIAEIVKAPPPLEPDLAAYMEYVLANVVTMRFFVKHAPAADWFRWADEKGAFASLIDPMTAPTEAALHASQWFAERCAFDAPAETLAFFARHRRRIHARLWYAVALELTRRKPLPNTEIVSAWVLALTSLVQPGWDTFPLGDLLRTHANELSPASAFLLFRTLASTRPEPDEMWLATRASEYPLFQIKLLGEADDLRTAWAATLRPRLPELWPLLYPMLTSLLSDATLQVGDWSVGDGTWDGLSLRRASIEDIGQDPFPDDWEFLLEAARDLLEWLAENRVESSTAVVEQWLQSGAMVIRRLAIHGLRLSTKAENADAMLDRVRREDWLYAPPGKHEVFALVRESFRLASKAAQRAFVDHAESAALPGEEAAEDDDARRSFDYLRYNVAVWLAASAPDSEDAQGFLIRQQARHADFEQREHPDLDAWSSGITNVSPRSPWTPDQLIEMGPDGALPLLIAFEGAGHYLQGPTRAGLLAVLTDACVKSFAWSLEIARHLVEARVWDSDLWPAIFLGWRQPALSKEAWSGILDLPLNDRNLAAAQGREIVDLLEGGVEKEQIPIDSFERVERILDVVFEQATPDFPMAGDRVDWLAQAINHTGGRAMLVWLRALSRRRATSDGPWTALPGDYRERFDRVSASAGTAGQLARVVLASQVHFLFALDRDWTVRTIVPWFDWARDAGRAQQAWHGFLGWGRWNDALLSELLPVLNQTFTRLRTDLRDVTDRVIMRLAEFAVYASTNPLEAGWLRPFVRDADAEARSEWAMHVGRNLERLDPTASNRLWDQWVSAYWEERIAGNPRPLDEKERAAMTTWIFSFPGRADAVVEMVRRSDAPRDLDPMMLFRLVERKTAESHPAATGRLLAHAVLGATSLRYGCERLQELARLALSGGADRGDIHDIAEGMARLGCLNAADVEGLLA